MKFLFLALPLLLISFNFCESSPLIPTSQTVSVSSSCSNQGTCTSDINNAIANCKKTGTTCTVLLSSGTFILTGNVFSTLFYIGNSNSLTIQGNFSIPDSWIEKLEKNFYFLTGNNLYISSFDFFFTFFLLFKVLESTQQF
jgi:hypothetical protein